MNEQQIQTKITNYLKSIGAYTFKTITSNKAGVPDLIACVEGKFIAIEVKQHGGRVSELQKYHQELIKRSGGVAMVAYSVDEVKANLIQLTNKCIKD